ncbi:MAG: hypothetical protein HON70_35065 [Lentisphaerae bacterium]|jgi:hypothetical protein|nr:hypothetical protein [Lentisphaerota bacterium]
MYLNYSAQKLFLDVFVIGANHVPPTPSKGLHRGSCVEFGFSCTSALGLEACMALATDGSMLHLRRQHGEPVGTVSAHSHLRILHHAPEPPRFRS